MILISSHSNLYSLINVVISKTSIYLKIVHSDSGNKNITASTHFTWCNDLTFVACWNDLLCFIRSVIFLKDTILSLNFLPLFYSIFLIPVSINATADVALLLDSHPSLIPPIGWIHNSSLILSNIIVLLLKILKFNIKAFWILFAIFPFNKMSLPK